MLDDLVRRFDFIVLYIENIVGHYITIDINAITLFFIDLWCNIIILTIQNYLGLQKKKKKICHVLLVNEIIVSKIIIKVPVTVD